MFKFRFLWIALLVALVGCSTTKTIDSVDLSSLAAQAKPISSDNKANAGGEPPPSQSMLSDEKFLKLLNTEIERCEARADGFDLDSHKARSMNIAIAAVGIIAGSIIVPSLAASGAAKSAIAAWGGVSGAANAAQLTMNANGRSTDAAIRVQKQFATNVQTLMTKLKDLRDPAAGAAFIYELRIACTIGAPIPEGERPPAAAAPSGAPGAPAAPAAGKS